MPHFKRSGNAPTENRSTGSEATQPRGIPKSWQSTSASSEVAVPALISPLPGGGSLYTYNYPGGQVDQVPVPPTGFDPATASAEELATYDSPPRPSQSGQLVTWQTAMSAYRGSVAPTSTVEFAAPNGTVTSSNSPGTLTSYSGNWSGYYAGTYQPSTPTYVAVDGEAVAPDMVSNECAVGTTSIQAAIWVGLGGSSTSSPGLVQQGVAWCNPDLSTSPEWVPVTEFASTGPPRWFCNYTSWTIPQGDTVLNEMSYSQSSGAATFYLEDVTTGIGHGCSRTPPTGWGFDGSTADWITEQVDPSAYGLAHYDTFSFGDANAELDSTGGFVTLGSRSSTGLTTGCSSSYTQYPGSINSNETSFTQYWNAYQYSC